MKKLILLPLLLLSANCFATWDTSTPAGSESKSLGDDRIRELKTDIQTSLQYLGNTSYFPGADSSNPRYIPTISTVTSSNRPSGNAAPGGRVIINTSSSTFEIVNSTGGWNPINILPSSGTITNVHIQAGAVRAEEIQDDAVNFQHITVNAVGSSEIAPNAVNTSELASYAVTTIKIATQAVTYVQVSTFPKFHAYVSGSDLVNVTGDGTEYIIGFDGETIDTHNGFDVTTGSYTVPAAGYYQLHTQVLALELSLRASVSFLVNGSKSICARGAIKITTQPNDMTLSASCIALLQTGDRVSVMIEGNGGSKGIDVAADDPDGDDTTDNVSIFWGSMIP